MKKITYQDIFDAAWQAFIVEGKPPAVSSEDRCAYLTDDGRKCAIGLVLPDGHPAQNYNSWAHELVADFPELWADEIIEGDDIIDTIQSRLHDGLIFFHGWQACVNLRHEYLKVAEDFDLTVPE